MSGLPYRSRLSPYESEIVELRSRRPPVSYKTIVILLRERYGITTSINGLFTFLKVRRKWDRRHQSIASTPREGEKKTSPGARPSGSGRADPWKAIERMRAGAGARSHPEQQKILKTFTPSNQYNLTRLSPEEAEAFKRKLRQEIESGE